MEITDEMQKAFELIEEGTDNVFITGKAGAGKSTFLKELVKRHKKEYVVTASTGVAAVNIGGVTLHSLFKIPFGVINPNQPIGGALSKPLIELFNKIDVLIIDEISMVRPDVLDYIDCKLRLARYVNEPFGGIQLVMFGDLKQLPPVVKKNEAEVLSLFYHGAWFFFSKAIREATFKMIEFTRIFRQSEQRFIDILNHIRDYKLTPLDMEDLDEHRSKLMAQNYDNGSVHLCATRKQVAQINLEKLGTPTHTFKSETQGRFPDASMPCESTLQLRIGARVILLVNDWTQGFHNGSTGEIEGFEPEKKIIYVKLDTGKIVKIEPFKWSEYVYEVKEGKLEQTEVGSFTQYPLALGWAMTIHKSQGLTFDKVTLHLPFTFAAGQLYVALSRCKTMDGVTTENFISPKLIIPDIELQAFDKAMERNDNFYNSTTYMAMRLIYESNKDKSNQE